MLYRPSEVAADERGAGVLAAHSALSRVRTPLLLAQRKRADAYALSHAEGEKATLKKCVSQIRAMLRCLQKSLSK